MSNQDISSIIADAQKPEETLEQVIERLSKIPKLEYEMQRKTISKELDIRVSTLDEEVEKLRSASVDNVESPALQEVEPWDEDVNLVKLLDEIRDQIKRFIICEPETINVSTLWIAFTWVIESVQVAPIAFITAPEMQCGKSQLLSVISSMVKKPAIASNISPSVVFRMIESHCPTLLIDEADSFLNGREELRGIINSGHTRQTSYVWRSVGDDHEPKQFSTWGAKAICGIGNQAATIMDRSIILELRRKLPNEKIERLRHANKDDFFILRRKLSRFAIDASKYIECARPKLPEALSDRAQDNWEPLLAIADYAAGHWPSTARQTALIINAKGKDEDNQSAGIMLLYDIQDIFEEDKYRNRISSADLLEKLHILEDRPWGDWYRGKPITSNKVARYLKPFDIRPKTIREGNKTFKGYQKDDFMDAISRYLTDEAVTTPQVNETNSYSKPQIVTLSPNVTDEKTLKATESMDCYTVTDETAVPWPLD